MRTIKAIEEIANKENYSIIKNGPDNYDLWEKGVVVDFTKPIKIDREIPPLASHKAYNGVPLYLFTYTPTYYINFELWCYIMNKQDGDYIHFKDILNVDMHWCNTIEEILYHFDLFVNYGYLRETAEYLQFYAYPINDGIHIPFNYMGAGGNVERLAPYKYLE